MDSLEIKVTTPGLDESITTVKELKKHIAELRDKLVTISYGTTEWDSTVQELTASVSKLTQVQSAAKDGIANLSSTAVSSTSSVKGLKAHIQELRDSLVNIDYGSEEWNATVQELTTSVDKLNQVQNAAKDGIANISSAATSSTSSVNALKAHIQELRDSLVNIDYGSEKWNSTVQDLTASVAKLTQVQNAEKEQVTLNDGSYKSIEAKMKELTQVYKTMSVVTDEDRQKQIALAVEINSLNDELKSLDAAIGNHQREVGNYKAAFEGLKGTFEITKEAGEQLASGFSAVGGIIGVTASEASSANSAFSVLSGTFSVVASVTDTLGRSTEAMSKAYEIATEFGDVFKKSKDDETKSIITNTAAENASTKASKASTAATASKTAAENASSKATKAATASTTAQTAATNAADKATKTFNKTLLANPFTAIIVVIVALIANLKEIINVFQSVGQALGFIGESTNEFENATEKLTEKFDKQNKELERELKLLEASGASTKDIIKEKLKLAKAQEADTKATLENAKARLKQLEADGAWKRFWNGTGDEYEKLQEEVKKLTEQLEKSSETVLDLQAEETAADIKEKKDAQKRREDAAKKSIENIKKVAEEQKKALEKTKADAKTVFKSITDAWFETLNKLKTVKTIFDTESIQSENANLVRILGKSADEITKLVESTGTYINGVFHTALHESINEIKDTAEERKKTFLKQYKIETDDLESYLNDKKDLYKKLVSELAQIEATSGRGSSLYKTKLKEVNALALEINRIIKEIKPNIKAINKEASDAVSELANIGNVSLAKGLFNEGELITLQNDAGTLFTTYRDVLSTAEGFSTDFAKNIRALKSLYDDGVIDFDQYTIGIKNAQDEYTNSIEAFKKTWGNLSLMPDQGFTKEEAEQFNAELKEAIKYAYSVRPQDIVDILAENNDAIVDKAAERSDNVMMKFDAKMKVLSMQLVGTVNQSMIEMAAGGKEAAEGLILDSTNQFEQEVDKAQSVLGNYLSGLSGFDWDGFFGNSWAKEKELLNTRFESQLEFLNASIQLYKDTLNDPDLSPEMQLQLTDELNALLLEKQTMMNEQAEANAERTAKNIQSVFNGVTAAIGVASDFLNAKMNMHKSNADRIMKNEKLSEKEREKLLVEEQNAYNKAFKANKAVQYANTVVNTATSAMSAYSALAGIPIIGPALGAAAAAAAVAAGAIQIKIISAQEPEDISGGSSGGASTGDVGAATTPTIDVNALLNADQESQNLNSDYYTDLQASKVQEQKVYVVESDISETQNTTRTQVSQSSF